MRSLRRTFALAGALVLLAAPAHAAGPTAAEQKIGTKILAAYQTTGQVDACKYTPEELELALAYANSPQVRQYAADFPAIVRDALATHARGDCDEPEATPTPVPTEAAVVPPATSTGSSGGGGGSAVGAAGGTGTATQRVVPDPPAPSAVARAAQPASADPALERAASASAGGGAPIPLIGLGVLSSLALLCVMLLAVLRRLGTAGGPLAPAYHSWREAQWRAGGVWEDFRDWLSTGR